MNESAHLGPGCVRRRPGAGRAAQAYIKISEAEIADDYPEPAQYEKARAAHSALRHPGSDRLFRFAKGGSTQCCHLGSF